MNRRGFLVDILKAGVAAAILPSALTYSRRWRKSNEPILVPVGGPTDRFFDPSDYRGQWSFIDVPVRFTEENGIFRIL